MATGQLGRLELMGGALSSKIVGESPKTIPLVEGRRVIGRSAKADILLVAEKEGKHIISRSHAALVVSLKQRSVVVEDLGSLNGVYVNDVRIRQVELKDGDRVQFGGMSDVPEGRKLNASDCAIVYEVKLNNSKKNTTPSNATAHNAAKSTVSTDNSGKRKTVQQDSLVNIVAQKASHENSNSSSNKRKKYGDETVAIETNDSEEEQVVAKKPKLLSSSKATNKTPGEEALGSLQKTSASAQSAAKAPRPAVSSPPPQPPEPRQPEPQAQQQAQHPVLQKDPAVVQMLETLRAEHRSDVKRLEDALALLQTTLTSFLDQQTSALKASSNSHSSNNSALSSQNSQGTTTKANTNRDNRDNRDSVNLQGPLREALSCLVCRDLLLEAAVLPCTHSLCTPCLRPIDQATLVCPLCDASIATKSLKLYRSSSLDTAVLVLLEGESEEVRTRYRQRGEEVSGEVQSFFFDSSRLRSHQELLQMREAQETRKREEVRRQQFQRSVREDDAEAEEEEGASEGEEGESTGNENEEDDDDMDM